MISHWLQIVAYNTTPRQRHEFQHVEGRVCIFQFPVGSSVKTQIIV